MAHAQIADTKFTPTQLLLRHSFQNQGSAMERNYLVRRSKCWMTEIKKLTDKLRLCSFNLQYYIINKLKHIVWSSFPDLVKWRNFYFSTNSLSSVSCDIVSNDT